MCEFKYGLKSNDNLIHFLQKKTKFFHEVWVS